MNAAAAAYIAACRRANASSVGLPALTETVPGIATTRHVTVQGIEAPPARWIGGQLPDGQARWGLVQKVEPELLQAAAPSYVPATQR